MTRNEFILALIVARLGTIENSYWSSALPGLIANAMSAADLLDPKQLFEPRYTSADLEVIRAIKELGRRCENA